MAVDLEALSNDLDILTAFPLIEENIVATAKWFEGINPITGVSDGVKRWSTSGFVQRYDGATAAFVDLEWSKMVFGSSGMSIVDDAGVGLTISLDTSNQTILDADNAFGISVNNTEIIKAYSTGLAGVNTANPAYAWDVGGDINFTGTLYNNGSAVSLVTQTYVDAADTNLQSQITTLGTTDTSLQNQINTLGTTDTSLQTQITTLTSVIAQTSANFRGEWSSATTYQQYDQVLRNGIRYYSQVSSNLNNDPASSPAQWSLFVNVFSGSVGIGTSSPQDLLHIKNSSAGSNAGLRLENADQTWALYCRGFDSDKFKIQDIDANTSPFIIETTAPNNTLYLDSSGNVGIGTSSPEIQQWRTNSTVLTVLAGSTSDGVGTLELGSQKADSDLEQHGVITFAATSQSGNHKHIAAIEAISDGSTANQRGGRLDFRVKSDGSTSDTVAMSIREGGKVGIGTSSPSYPFEVREDATGTPKILVRSISNGDPTMSFLSDSKQFTMGIDDTSNAFAISEGSGLGSADRLVIDSSGKVGIGTSSPNHIVHIKETANSTTTANLILDSIVQYGYEAGTFEVRRQDYYVSSFGAVWEDNDNSYARIGIRHSGSTVYPLTIRDNMIGIGTSSPSHKLDVVGDIQVEDFIRNSLGESMIGFLEGTSDDHGLTIGSSGESAGNKYDRILFSLNNAERMRIDSSGNVGIGTSSPAAKLNVAGGFVAGTGAWPTSSIGLNGNRSGLVSSGESIFLVHNSDTNIAAFNAAEIQITARSSAATPTQAGAKIRAGKDNAVDGNEDGFLAFDVSQENLGFQEKMRIAPDGNVEVKTGNLVIGTSGKGIDFSATSGTGTSELLDDYEEGTFTPAYATTDVQFSDVSYDVQNGSYTKIGRQVFFTLRIQTSSITVGSASGNVRISGLPFAPSSTSAIGRSAVAVTQCTGFAGDAPSSGYIFENQGVVYLKYRSNSHGDDLDLAISDLGTGSNSNHITLSGTYQI